MTSDHGNETNCDRNSTHPCWLGDRQTLEAVRVTVVTLLIIATFLLNSALLYILWRVTFSSFLPNFFYKKPKKPVPFAENVA